MGGEEVRMEKRMRIGDETAILSLISLFNFEHSFFNRLSSKVANLPKIEWMALKFVFHLPFSFYAIQQKAETAGVCESPFYHSFMEFYSATPPI